MVHKSKISAQKISKQQDGLYSSKDIHSKLITVKVIARLLVMIKMEFFLKSLKTLVSLCGSYSIKKSAVLFK